MSAKLEQLKKQVDQTSFELHEGQLKARNYEYSIQELLEIIKNLADDEQVIVDEDGIWIKKKEQEL